MVRLCDGAVLKEKIMNDDIGKYLQRMKRYEFLKLVRQHRPLLTTEEAAAYLGMKKRTLESWRDLGKGPRHVQMGKFVRYHLDVLDAWITTKGQPSSGSTGHSVTSSLATV